MALAASAARRGAVLALFAVRAGSSHLPAAPCAVRLFASSDAGSSGASSSSSSSSSSSTTQQTKSRASPSVRVPQSINFHDLRDNPGATKKELRKGRGVGGGHGLARSAGRGSKGQKSHEGGGIPWAFEGGQSPLWRRTPKFGYMHKMFKKDVQVLNLDKIQLWVDTGRLDSSKPITMRTLVECGLVTKVKDGGVKLLADGAGKFKAKISIEVTQASHEAIKAIEGNGGSVVCVYYTPLALRSLLKPSAFEFPIKSPLPPPKKIGYYTSYANRGYLSSKLQLKQMKEAIARGDKAPSMRVPVYVGGGPLANATDDLFIPGVGAPPAEAAAMAAAQQQAKGGEGAAAAGGKSGAGAAQQA